MFVMIWAIYCALGEVLDDVGGMFTSGGGC